MLIPSKFDVSVESETINLANRFSSVLKKGDVIVLNGELGTGKTFFIKNTLKNFDVYNASSPTFAIVNEYEGNGIFYHIDFYRIEKINELYDIGIENYLYDKEAISFIEWGNLYEEVLPKNRIEINFKLNNNFTRQIEFNKI